MIFRLVLNELKIKLDGVNESEESINGEFDQPRIEFCIFPVFVPSSRLKMTKCKISSEDLRHALDFAVFYYS